MLPYHVIDEHAYEPVVVWNGAGTGASGTKLLLTDDEPRRRQAPRTAAAPPLVDSPEDMVRQALGLRPMSVAAMSRHYGVARAVFARAVHKLRAAGELCVVRTERVSDPHGGTRLTRVYGLKVYRRGTR